MRGGISSQSLGQKRLQAKKAVVRIRDELYKCLPRMKLDREETILY